MVYLLEFRKLQLLQVIEHVAQNRNGDRFILK